MSTYLAIYLGGVLCLLLTAIFVSRSRVTVAWAAVLFILISWPITLPLLILFPEARKSRRFRV